ncbi:MAG: hypothetical protein Q9205_001123 [Flavoplaca limonia]
MEAQPCPFCPFSDTDPYFLAQHVETFHPEDGEPSFVPRHWLEAGLPLDYTEATTIREAPSQQYAECECGEAIAASDFEDHVLLHSAEAADNATDLAEITEPDLPTKSGLTALSRPADSTDSTNSIPMNIHPSGTRHSTNSAKPWQASQAIGHGGQSAAKDRLALLLESDTSRNKRDVAKHRDAKRLGETELGPYAHEDQMPAWLQRHLERGAKVTIVNQISNQGQLVPLEIVANEARGALSVLAQLCEQDTMLAKVYLCHPGVQHVFKMAKEGGFCGYRNIQMMAAQSQGHELFPGRLPSVLELQELIESAWDQGINSVGKVETGGIRGTRKYIGTPEDFVGPYLLPASRYESVVKETVVLQPSTMLIGAGHSLTIVGLEVRKSGSRNLLVFDPSFQPSPGIQRLIGAKFRTAAPEKLLKAYRRGDRYLGKHSTFELLKYGT